MLTRRSSAGIGLIISSVGWLILGSIWLIAAFPVALWLGMAIDAVWFYTHLGRWPRYGNPDPGSDSLPSQLQTLWPSLGSALVILVAIIAAGLWHSRTRRPEARAAIAGVAFLGLWLSAYFLFRFDPGGVFDWWMD